MHEKLGEDTDRTGDSNSPQKCSTWHHVHKAHGRQRKRDDLNSNCVCFPKAPLHMIEYWVFLRMAEHLIAHWKGGINALICFVFVKGFFLLNLLCHNT